MNRYPRMTALARSFPTLAHARGVDPFTPEALDEWAAGGGEGSGSQHAARFCLEVFNPDATWEAGPFRLVPAMFCWDRHHRAAFRAWCEAPWTA